MYLFSARGSAAFTPLQCPAGWPRWELQALAPIPNLKRAEARAPGTLNTYAVIDRRYKLMHRGTQCPNAPGA